MTETDPVFEALCFKNFRTVDSAKNNDHVKNVVYGLILN
jgi:hypothetical protein